MKEWQGPIYKGLRWGWSQVPNIVDVRERRESDGAEWHNPVTRNGFNLNASGVVTNPFEFVPAFGKNVRQLSMSIANPAPDCWGVGFEISLPDHSGRGWGCKSHPIYTTGLMAVAMTLAKMRVRHTEIATVDWTPLVAEAVARDFEAPELMFE